MKEFHASTCLTTQLYLSVIVDQPQGFPVPFCVRKCFFFFLFACQVAEFCKLSGSKFPQSTRRFGSPPAGRPLEYLFNGTGGGVGVRGEMCF